MPVGNDIIDRDEASKHRPQYYQRLKTSSFTEDEWLLDDLPQTTDGLWMLWSLKEATYKSLVQGEWDGRRFNPMDYTVTSLKPYANDFIAEITFRNRMVRAITSLQKQFLHSVTQPENGLVSLFETFECPSMEYDQQSYFTRERAIRFLSDRRNIPIESLEIMKNEDQVPQFFQDGQLIENVDLSISHHGRFGAFAMTFNDPLP